MQIENKSYVIVLQCDIAMERCSGYFCEKSLNERTGGFSEYPKDKQCYHDKRLPEALNEFVGTAQLINWIGTVPRRFGAHVS